MGFLRKETISFLPNETIVIYIYINIINLIRY